MSSKFNVTHFASNLSCTGIHLCGSGSVLGIPVQIHKGHEYGSNLNPDPQHGVKLFFLPLKDRAVLAEYVEDQVAGLLVRLDLVQLHLD